MKRLVYIRRSGSAAPRMETIGETVVIDGPFDWQLVRDGDIVLLEGGYEYPPFEIASKKDVIIGSYGLPAVICGGEGNGIVISRCERILLFGLKVTGSGWRKNRKGNGILIGSSKHITIRNVEMCGFRKAGLNITASETVLVEGCFSHENGFCGIGTSIGESKNRNIKIRYCKALDNAGDPDIIDNHSGSGIVIFHASDVLVEYCEAAGNGWAQRQRNINGPVGIWCACDCSDVVFRKNIAHHNCTQPGSVDGDGFDFDGAVVNSTMEYNCSYDNEGSGYLLCEYGSGMDWKNNNIHCCISINDGRRVEKQGSLQFYGPDGLKLYESHTNDCLFVPAKGRHGIVNQEIGKDCTGLSVENCIIVEGTAPAVSDSKNPHLVIKNNEIIRNADVYNGFITGMPRLTNPRKLDGLPVFRQLAENKLKNALQTASVRQLFDDDRLPPVIQGKLKFTYYLNGKDFEGSCYSGNTRLLYDHILPGMALELKKDSHIQFPYPAWDSSKRHLAVLTARLQSPDTEAYLYIAQDNKMIHTVSVAGSVSDYHPICLSFDGFDGIPSIGVVMAGGAGSVMLETLRVYELYHTDTDYPCYPDQQRNCTAAYRCIGDVYNDGQVLVLSGCGSAVLSSYAPAGHKRVTADVDAAEEGGFLFANAESGKYKQFIHKGRNTYSLELTQNDKCQYGVWNGILDDTSKLRVYRMELIDVV